MPPVGFEPTISADERPQTYAIDRAATGTGATKFSTLQFYVSSTDCINVFYTGLRTHSDYLPTQHEMTVVVK